MWQRGRIVLSIIAMFSQVCPRAICRANVFFLNFTFLIILVVNFSPRRALNLGIYCADFHQIFTVPWIFRLTVFFPICQGMLP